MRCHPLAVYHSLNHKWCWLLLLLHGSGRFSNQPASHSSEFRDANLSFWFNGSRKLLVTVFFNVYHCKLNLICLLKIAHISNSWFFLLYTSNNTLIIRVHIMMCNYWKLTQNLAHYFFLIASGEDDCGDNSDEDNEEFCGIKAFQCSSSEWQCPNLNRFVDLFCWHFLYALTLLTFFVCMFNTENEPKF